MEKKVGKKVGRELREWLKRVGNVREVREKKWIRIKFQSRSNSKGQGWSSFASFATLYPGVES